MRFLVLSDAARQCAIVDVIAGVFEGVPTTADVELTSESILKRGMSFGTKGGFFSRAATGAAHCRSFEGGNG